MTELHELSRKDLREWDEEHGHRLKIPLGHRLPYSQYVHDDEQHSGELWVHESGARLRLGTADDSLLGMVSTTELGKLQAQYAYWMLAKKKIQAEARIVYELLMGQPTPENYSPLGGLPFRWSEHFYGPHPQHFDKETLRTVLKAMTKCSNKCVELFQKIADHPETVRRQQEKEEAERIEEMSRRSRYKEMEEIQQVWDEFVS